MDIRFFRQRLLLAPLVLAATGCFSSATAMAGTPETPSGFAFSGSLTLVNDYVWRGQSQTWGKSALQFGVEASHASGVYAGLWASNVSDQWVPGAHVETDWYAGYRGNFPGAWSDVGYDLNVLYVYYPNGNFDRSGFNLPAASPDTAETYAGLSYKWLGLKAGRVLTRFYGWDNVNSGVGAFAGDPGAWVNGNTNGSYYAEANANYELAPGWNVIAQAGHQTISNSTRLSWNYYKLGVTRAMGPWSGNLSYSLSSNPGAFRGFAGLRNDGATYDDARSRVLFSIARSF